jgi:predicted MFS family arabinose efflux permease
LCGASFVYFAALGVTTPVLPRFIVGPAGGTKIELGIAVAAFSLTALVLRPVVVPVARRFPSSRVMAVGSVTVGVADGLLVLTPSPVLIIALRAGAGAGEAFFFVLASAAVYDLVRTEEHGEAVGYFSAALSAGLLASPVLGELARQHLGYNAVWVLAFLLCLAAGALATTLRLPRLRPSTRARRRVLHPAALRPGFLLAVNTFGAAAFGTFTALYVAHLGRHSAAPEFAAFAVALVCVRVAGASLLDRIDRRWLAAFAMFVQALGLGLLALARSTIALTASSAVIGVGTALGYPALMALATGTASEAERPEAVATATACFDAGYAASALGLAVVLQLGGFTLAYTASALALSAGALISGTSRRRKPHARHSS